MNDLLEMLKLANRELREHKALFVQYAISTDREIEDAKEMASTWASIAVNNAIEIGRLECELRRRDGA